MIPAIYEIAPLAVLAGTTLYCAWRWRKASHALDVSRDMAAYQENEKEIYLRAYKDTKAKYYRAHTALDAADLVIAEQRNRMIDAEDRLRKIEQQRHLSAKHARAAQLAKQRQAILDKAGQLLPPKMEKAA